MSITQTAQSATRPPTPIRAAPAGHKNPLNGHSLSSTQVITAVEGQDSLQATPVAVSRDAAPAGNGTAQLATIQAASIGASLAGHQAGRDHLIAETQCTSVPVADVPGAQLTSNAHPGIGTGEQGPSLTNVVSAAKADSSLADPLLALAADVLSDLEKVRIANENRLRQLTRSTKDKDGEIRGFGLDESHLDVARLAALVGMLAEAEHKATLNLGRLMRAHPLGPWVRSMKGVGEKQAARLLAAIGDPYIRPEIVREDGVIEPSRPRLVSELWAFAGYHVIGNAAPRRARGQKANWSGAAKMRAYLVAESCMKQPGTPYRAIYDATRAKYAGATHATECVRCGPSGKPAPAGSPLSDGHKHARALRAVAKEVLRDLWREAKRLHEQALVSGQNDSASQRGLPADGLYIPTGRDGNGIQTVLAGGEQNDGGESVT